MRVHHLQLAGMSLPGLPSGCPRAASLPGAAGVSFPCLSLLEASSTPWLVAPLLMSGPGIVGPHSPHTAVFQTHTSLPPPSPLKDLVMRLPVL